MVTRLRCSKVRLFLEGAFRIVSRMCRLSVPALMVFAVPGFAHGQHTTQSAVVTGHRSDQPIYRLAQVLPHSTGYVNGIACSRDGSLLAVAGDDGRVTIWNTASGALVRELGGHHGPVYSVAITSDGGTLAAAGFDGTIHLWELNSGREIRVLAGHQGWVNSVAFAGNDRTLVSGGRDRTVRVWNVNTGKMLQVMQYPSEVFTVAADSTGRLLASDKENSFSIREISTMREVAAGAPGQWGINALVFSPGGRQLISSGYDGILWVWNIEEAKLDRRVNIEGSPIISLAITADGNLLAALCTGNGTVALFDTTTWKELASLKAVTYPVGSVALSADGHILAAGGGDSPVRIWQRSDAR
jgi:WD40 repeat protein